MGYLSKEEQEERLAEKWRRILIEGQQSMQFPEPIVASEVDEQDVSVYDTALKAWLDDGYPEEDFDFKGFIYRARVARAMNKLGE